MTASERELFAQLVATPDDAALRMVYADWLEERGDRRGAFLRGYDRLVATEPDEPGRLAREGELSVLRRGLDPQWLAVVEPPIEQTRWCECLKTGRVPPLHRALQDTECDGWKRLLDYIERAAADQRMRFEPRPEMASHEEWLSIRTLPPEMAKLTSVTSIKMYGSGLMRLPPELGQMVSLRSIDFYTSYRLHWYPYEMMRAPLRYSVSSTRTLYGNFKLRWHFPALAPRSTTTRRNCSVCNVMFDDTQAFRVWISLPVGEVLPMLVNACSQACVDALPAPPEGYVAHPHRGGADVTQPPRR